METSDDVSVVRGVGGCCWGVPLFCHRVVSRESVRHFDDAHQVPGTQPRLPRAQALAQSNDYMFAFEASKASVSLHQSFFSLPPRSR